MQYGEGANFKSYDTLMDDESPLEKVLLADKGCDADFIRQDMDARGGFANSYSRCSHFHGQRSSINPLQDAC